MHVGLSRIGSPAPVADPFRQPSFAPVYFPNEALPSVDTPVPEAQPERHGHSFEVFERLSSLRCDTDADRKKCDGLIAEAAALMLRAQEFEQGVIAKSRSELERQWKEAKAECRKQAKVVGKLDADWNNCEATVLSLCAAYDSAMNELKAVSAAPLPRWANDREILGKQEAIEQAKQKAVDASMGRAAALNERQRIEQQLHEEQKKMNELAATEQRLRHAVDGTPYTDLEYGLEVPR